jgi:hypothetical protein
MSAGKFPSPPDAAARDRMIAETEAQLLDEGLTEERRQVILILIEGLRDGHFLRRPGGRFVLTTRGAAWCQKRFAH